MLGWPSRLAGLDFETELCVVWLNIRICSGVL